MCIVICSTHTAARPSGYKTFFMLNTTDIDVSCSNQLNLLINDKVTKNFGILTFEPWHDIPNNVVCATSKGSDQPAHTRSLIRAFASRFNIL